MVYGRIGVATAKAARFWGSGWPGRSGRAVCTLGAAAHGGVQGALPASAAKVLCGTLAHAAAEKAASFAPGCVRGVRTAAVDRLTVAHSTSRAGL